MECHGVADISAAKARRRGRGPVKFPQDAPRILLADDQQAVLRTVSSLLQGKYELVGVAENGEKVLELVRTKSPDLAVLDICMPVLNGIDTAIRLRASGSNIKLIFMTVHEDSDFVETAISVGALGYVLKPHLVTDLLPAIREVLTGKVYISPSIFAR